MIAGEDADHWLFRLGAVEGLEAARRELEDARRRCGDRRAVLAHVRRAGGMACNAVLVHAATAGALTRVHVEQVWGRSYVEHLGAVADGRSWSSTDPLPSRAMELAKVLIAVSGTGQGRLVPLGRGPHAEAEGWTAAAAELVTVLAAVCGPS